MSENKMQFPTVVKPTELATALQQSKITETPAGGGTNYLRFAFETGEYFIGKDNDEVTGDEVLINTQSIKHGWILWSGGKPKKSFVPFTQDLPMPMEPIGEDQPAEGRSIMGAFLPDGEPFQFDTSSYGGRKAIDQLLSQIQAKAATGSDYLYPKCRLDSESYQTTKGKKRTIFNPFLTIIGWCDMNGTPEGDTPEAIEDNSAEEAAAPVTRRRRRGED